VGSFGGPIGIAFGALLGSQINVFHLGGAGILLERSKAEWTKLKQRLDDEAAWPLCLIYDDSSNPFEQHQLLAVGYAERNDGIGTITAWDNRFFHSRVDKFRMSATCDRRARRDRAHQAR
jgi:hypothetical protein